MLTSSRYGVSYPNPDRSDVPDIPLHLGNIVAGLEQSAMYGQGTLAARPVSTGGSPGKQGRFYASTDETPNRLYYDYGTGWFQVGALAAGAVGSTELADNSVTAAKIATGAVGTDEIADGSITNPDYQDNSVGFSKLASALKPSQGAGAAVEALRALGTAAGLAAAGTHASQHALAGADPLPAASVGSSQIQDGAITSADIADGTIVSADIADGTIEGRKLNVHLGASPPSSPQDGDIWILPADATNGVYWRFTYVSAQATYKWVFIGGPPLYSETPDEESTSSGTYAALTHAGPSVALPRGGDYDIEIGMEHYANVGGLAYGMSFDIGAAGAVDTDGISVQDSSGSEVGSASRRVRKTGLTAVTLTAKYRNFGASTSTYKKRRMYVSPVRII